MTSLYMAGYGDFPTLASARQCNCISVWFKIVAYHVADRSVRIPMVCIKVSLPITFKALSVLGDHFDEDLGRIVFQR